MVKTNSLVSLSYVILVIPLPSCPSVPLPPGDPCSPGGPCSPLGPCSPGGPCSPCVPVSPRSPFSEANQSTSVPSNPLSTAISYADVPSAPAPPPLTYNGSFDKKGLFAIFLTSFVNFLSVINYATASPFTSFALDFLYLRLHVLDA